MADVSVANSTSGLPLVIFKNVQPVEVPAVRSIYGISKKGNIWFAPGFLPFAEWVLEDIESMSSVSNFNKSKSLDNLKSKIDDDIKAMSSSDLKGYVPPISPYDHQVEALSLVMHMPRLGLFLDPGLGKTKVGCDLIQYTRSIKPNSFWLIIALKVNQFTWAKEMEFHSKGQLSLIPITATGKARDKKIDEALAVDNCVGIVVTYDTCRVAKESLISKVPFTDTILDESHSIRTPRSGKTKAVLEVINSKPVERRVLLSGTPSLGSPQHLWAQLKVLGDFIVPNSWHFINQYAIRSPYNKHIITGYKNLDELNDLVTSVSLRKTAEEFIMNSLDDNYNYK